MSADTLLEELEKSRQNIHDVKDINGFTLAMGIVEKHEHLQCKIIDNLEHMIKIGVDSATLLKYISEMRQFDMDVNDKNVVESEINHENQGTDTSPRDCPDCGMPARGGLHWCILPEGSSTLNECRQDFDKYCIQADFGEGESGNYAKEWPSFWKIWQAAWNTRAPIKSSISKEWCMEMAALEPDDGNVAAGIPPEQRGEIRVDAQKLHNAIFNAITRSLTTPDNMSFGKRNALTGDIVQAINPLLKRESGAANAWSNPRHSYSRDGDYSCVKCGDPLPYGKNGSKRKRPCPGFITQIEGGAP